MAGPSPKAAAYIKFLNLVQAVKDLPSFPSIDATEERLLNQLATKWHNGKQVTVIEAMQMSAETSATTIHRRLKSLRTKGIIELRVDATDNRIKYVSPTPLATDYFLRLGQCLELAAGKR